MLSIYEVRDRRRESAQHYDSEREMKSCDGRRHFSLLYMLSILVAPAPNGGRVEWRERREE